MRGETRIGARLEALEPACEALLGRSATLSQGLAVRLLMCYATGRHDFRVHDRRVVVLEDIDYSVLAHTLGHNESVQAAYSCSRKTTDVRDLNRNGVFVCIDRCRYGPRDNLRLPENVEHFFCEHAHTIECGHLRQGHQRLRSVRLARATTIGYGAFMGYTRLTSVLLPAADRICEGAFVGCLSLVCVSLPNARMIGNEAFRACMKLTSIALPAAETIGRHAFYECSSLASIELPAAKEINEGAFNECSNLTSIALPTAETIVWTCVRRVLKLDFDRASCCEEYQRQRLRRTHQADLDYPPGVRKRLA